jgi:hypothetical protein
MQSGPQSALSRALKGLLPLQMTAHASIRGSLVTRIDRQGEDVFGYNFSECKRDVVGAFGKFAWIKNANPDLLGVAIALQ